MDNDNNASSKSSSYDEGEIRKEVAGIFSRLSNLWVEKWANSMCKECEHPANLDNWLAMSVITTNFNPGPRSNDNGRVIKISHLCATHSHKFGVFICLDCERLNLERGPSRINHAPGCHHKHIQQQRSELQQQESQSKEKAADADNTQSESKEKAADADNTQSALWGSDGDDDNCGGNFDGDVRADDKTPIIHDHKIIEYLDTFNKQTAEYLKREYYQKGDGNRGLVVRARINKDIRGSLETHITDECVARELQNAKMYHKADKKMRDDIAASNLNIVQECDKERNELKGKYESSMLEIAEEIVAKIAGEQILQDEDKKSLMAKAKQVVNAKIESSKSWTASSKDRKTDPITDPNIIRTQITEGPNSIMKNLPLPGVVRLGSFSYIPIKDVVKLSFALGLPIRQYKEDKDWLHNKKYEGNYYETLHQELQTKTQTGTRICILRCWSDGFQPFAVKDNNKKFNSLQIVTATLLGEEGQNIIWPFALGFKNQLEHSVVMDRFRSEAKQLEEPFQVYCAIEKCLIWISVYLQVIMNDYPERCANTYTADNGLFTHRWMYSCRYCHETTPSCEKCRDNRVNRILSDKTAEGIKKEELTCCSDWHNIDSKITQYHHSSDKYPTTIGRDCPDPPPLVRLNFNILKNAIEDARQYFSSERNKTTPKPTKGKAKDFLQACGLQPKLASQVVDLLADNKSIEVLIPQIIAHPNISMEVFTIIPMHQFFLGVEKKLISIPFLQKHLPKSLSRESKKTCKIIVRDIIKSHKRVSDAKINWCHGVPFTSKDEDDLSTVSWLSENYIAFTRTSLVYFGYIDTTLDEVSCSSRPALEAFKEMRVLWFCLVAHVFADDKVHSCVIGDYVKLFLSACARYHDETIEEEDESKDHAESLRDDLPASKNNKKSKTFYENTSNFLSLLNVEEAVERFGSLRKLWEGNDEKFIQHIKKELSGFRHKDEHMKTLLLKMLRTKIFDIIDKDNQFSQRTTYARTIDFKTYDNVLSNEHFFSGVIIDGKMFMCFKSESGSTRSDMLFLALKNLKFTGEGCWNYNLWYETISIDENPSMHCSRHHVLEQSSDFFILFPLMNDGKKFTMICKSWKIRDKDGKFRLPTPLECTLTRSDEGKKKLPSEEIDSFYECEPKTKRRKQGSL